MRETDCSAYTQFSQLFGKSHPEGHRNGVFFSRTDPKNHTKKSTERSQHSHFLLPRISYSSTSSTEPESESRMEPWELNWDPLSVTTRPGRNASQPGHQWKCSKGPLTAMGERDSQVQPGEGGMELKDETHYKFKIKLHSVTQCQQCYQWMVSATLWSSIAAVSLILAAPW